MFQSSRTKKNTKTPAALDWIDVSTAQTILGYEKRPVLLDVIRANAALAPETYDAYVQVLIENLVAYCQLLPDSENYAYSQSGGLIDYALNRTDAALTLFQQFVIVHPGQAWSDQQILWQYALLTASLLQGIGKLYVGYDIQRALAKKQVWEHWSPFVSPLFAKGAAYTYTFTGNEDHDLRKRLNVLMAHILMPRSGMLYISASQEVLAVWLALLDEDYYRAGTLGAILIRADALALYRYFQDLDLSRTQRKRTMLGRMGAFSDTPHEPDYELAKVGVEFLQWLTHALENGKLVLNQEPLFLVPEGLLCLPEVFLMFLQKNPRYKNWLLVQKGLLSLGMHYTEGVDGSRFLQKSLQLKDSIAIRPFAAFLPEQCLVYHAQSGKTESINIMQLIAEPHAFYAKPVGQQNAMPALTHLNAQGDWVTDSHEPHMVRKQPFPGRS